MLFNKQYHEQASQLFKKKSFTLYGDLWACLHMYKSYIANSFMCMFLHKTAPFHTHFAEEILVIFLHIVLIVSNNMISDPTQM